MEAGESTPFTHHDLRDAARLGTCGAMRETTKCRRGFIEKPQRAGGPDRVRSLRPRNGRRRGVRRLFYVDRRRRPSAVILEKLEREIGFKPRLVAEAPAGGATD
jgi:hypothetical protein